MAASNDAGESDKSHPGISRVPITCCLTQTISYFSEFIQGGREGVLVREFAS